MDRAETDQIDHVLAAFSLERRGLPAPVVGGTLNWNYRVQTNRGVVFVRRHRAELDVARITGEHAVIGFAASHGIPVATPLRRSDGTTTVVTETGVWAVFPWVEGHTTTRAQTTGAEAFVLGELHGRIHAAFATHPSSKSARFTMRWDKSESLAVLGKVANLAAERHAEPFVQDAIAFQRDLLERTDIEPPSSFAALPCQLTHGDYHNHQVLLGEDGSAAAVIDWELYQVTARVWEVIRSLAFSALLHTPELDDYLRGYGRHVSLSTEECRLGVELWWQSRVNGVWVWTAYFLQGNERVAPFFPTIVPELKALSGAGQRSELAERMARVFADGRGSGQ
ncbi:MAG: phosphotransferase enzyme family protein [Tepidiformaceae bacterium]